MKNKIIALICLVVISAYSYGQGVKKDEVSEKRKAELLQLLRSEETQEEKKKVEKDAKNQSDAWTGVYYGREWIIYDLNLKDILDPQKKLSVQKKFERLSRKEKNHVVDTAEKKLEEAEELRRKVDTAYEMKELRNALKGHLGRSVTDITLTKMYQRNHIESLEDNLYKPVNGQVPSPESVNKVLKVFKANVKSYQEKEQQIPEADEKVKHRSAILAQLRNWCKKDCGDDSEGGTE